MTLQWSLSDELLGFPCAFSFSFIAFSNLLSSPVQKSPMEGSQQYLPDLGHKIQMSGTEQ